jgi:tRNA U34 2-thiouridine synthase MnmA/TrmU
VSNKPHRVQASSVIHLETVNWIGKPPLNGAITLARVRHRGALEKTEVTPREGDRVCIKGIAKPLIVSAGQSVVFYEPVRGAAGYRVLGGGVVASHAL